MVLFCTNEYNSDLVVLFFCLLSFQTYPVHTCHSTDLLSTDSKAFAIEFDPVFFVHSDFRLLPWCRVCPIRHQLSHFDFR